MQQSVHRYQYPMVPLFLLQALGQEIHPLGKRKKLDIQERNMLSLVGLLHMVAVLYF